VSLPAPPGGSTALEDFPSLTWMAHQPLARIHRQELGSMFFGTDQDGRWNPPSPGSDWGTCYVSTHPLGAALEVFGRLRVLPQREIDRRVLARIYLSSDVLLADMTHPSVVGRFGLTAEASTGAGTTTYPQTQQWALRLREAGFGGIHYAARHDPTLGSRSIELFGKASTGEDSDEPWSEWLEDSTATTAPIPADLIERLSGTFGFTILSGGNAL
jgi:hypothetical protein